MMALKIVKAVNQALGARGFLEVKDKPDFYPYHDGGGDSQAGLGGEDRVNSTPLSFPMPQSNLWTRQRPCDGPFHLVEGQRSDCVSHRRFRHRNPSQPTRKPFAIPTRPCATSTRKSASSWPNRSKTFRQNPQSNPPPRSASSTSPILDRFHLTSCKFCQWPLHDRNS
jgi:hypothetical protein